MTTDEHCWPPQCCAIAFISKARELLLHDRFDPKVIAHGLDVRVGPGDNNPWKLNVENNAHLQGARPSDLQNKWGEVFGSAPLFSFRHIPFSTVSFGLYWEVGAEALASGLVVGLGFDYSCISGGNSASHVCRVEAITQTKGDSYDVSIVDDFQNGLRRIERSETLEPAVRSVEGGFWLVGDRAKMHLPYALPWTA